MKELVHKSIKPKEALVVNMYSITQMHFVMWWHSYVEV